MNVVSRSRPSSGIPGSAFTMPSVQEQWNQDFIDVQGFFQAYSGVSNLTGNPVYD
jgi:hypothetical protein